ncbi:acetate--CoA ligase family protein [Gordonia sp. SCSIO 19800]|uniref:acetate--CoA ligase family protein n=1 Tax=Gordonia sp. SCSIO 19800 TaxID=2826926 RepID=UPI001B81C4E3|nr:acetate--CoA ligase family protein [Gordonia sp. SCSIO 19800]MBR7194620.1 acetate--CoA ligase family protein [Gordonia sp. SCSIO 19800]
MTDLSYLLTPRSVALIGASGTPGSPGYDAALNLVNHSRVQGSIHLVNPRRSEIEGHPCVAQIEDLPQDEVDTAVVMVSAASTVDAVERCAKRGVRFAIIPTGGLGEAGESGRVEEQKLREISRAYGIRIYGPNCPGLTNVNDEIFMSVSSGASADRVGGSIGLITQGGALGRNVMQYMDRGVGIGCWLSAGNEVDLELSDFIEHLVDDPKITTIACIIEGFSDGARFLAAARRAGVAGKPVAAMVLGRTDSGALAAQSHTAHMGARGKVARSLLRQHGVTVVDDIDELAETVSHFARGVPARSDSPCVVSFSGGAAVAAVDALELEEIRPAALEDATRQALREALPEFANAANPLDLTMEVMRRPEMAAAAVRALASDPGINTLVVPIPGDYGAITERFIQEMLRFEEGPASDGRVVAVWSSPRRGAGCTVLEERGILPFASTRSMARTLANAEAFRRWRALVSEDTSRAGVDPPRGESTNALGDAPGEWTEATAKRSLRERGVSVPRGTLVESREDLSAALTEVGFPVAMKIQSAALPHKTEVNGVILGVTELREALSAWDNLLEGARAAGVEATAVDGVLVEHMATPGTDLIVSVQRDATFGPISAVGVGGIFTEVLGDVVFFSGAPSSAELRAGLKELAAWPILSGFRGRRPVDCAAVESVLRNLITMVEGPGALQEVEINPLRVLDSDGSTVALDALITPGESEREPASLSR